MASLTKKLYDKKLIQPPSYLPTNIIYETIVGSFAYGVNTTDKSDYDILGICIPKKEIIFPHLNGEIIGFDKQIKKFEQFQAQHIFIGKKEYDLTVYNIVKFFRLAADCSPAIVESLFTPVNCILHITSIGNKIRENRHLFLSKKIFHTLKGYAFQQLNNIFNKKYENANEGRKKDVEKYGFSTKAAYHTVRLLNECEDVLITGDLDLQKNREQLKSIRRGEWTAEQIKNYFNDKERLLEELYVTSNKIPDKIREKEIKQLLIDCLEHHYGSLGECISNPDKYKDLVFKIHTLIHEDR